MLPPRLLHEPLLQPSPTVEGECSSSRNAITKTTHVWLKQHQHFESHFQKLEICKTLAGPCSLWRWKEGSAPGSFSRFGSWLGKAGLQHSPVCSLCEQLCSNSPFIKSHWTYWVAHSTPIVTHSSYICKNRISNQGHLLTY